MSIPRTLMNNITVNFLLQTIRVLHVGNYNDEELSMIYNFMSRVDNEILIHYLNSKTILSYESDLELFVEIADALIGIYESSEDYEKCIELKNKKEEAIKLLNN